MSYSTAAAIDAMNATLETGAGYVALRRLSTRDDVTLAEVGETCERVPASSLPGLWAAGYIAPALSPDASAAGTVTSSTTIAEDVWADLGRPAEQE